MLILCDPIGILRSNGRDHVQDIRWLFTYTERWHDTWAVIASMATLCAVIVALAIARVGSRARSKAQVEMERLRPERDEARRERGAAGQAERQRALEAQTREVVIRAAQCIDPDAHTDARNANRQQLGGGPAADHVRGRAR